MMSQSGASGESRGWYASPGTGSVNGRGCGMRWHPVEMVAMVAGFALYWPVGLAVIGFKLWQRKSGYPGTLQGFVQDKLGAARNARDGWRGVFRFGGGAAGGASAAGNFGMGGFGMGGFGMGPRPTGNSAFDEWRANELKRLEEERRKLEDAEREFAAHIEELRRARDREEFDRFMANRRRATGDTTSV